MLEHASVSVIIPCYRCRETIARAVASVAEQTQIPAEVILVDDFSGDGTLEALQSLQSEYPRGWVKIIASTENGGPGTARNTGWDAAAQPYIAFLDADDSWHPQKIEIQYGWMVNHPGAALTGHACEQVKEVSSDSSDFSPITNAPEFYKVGKSKLLLSNRFATRSVMLRGDIHQRFEEGKRYSEDYLLWLEICCAGHECYRAELPLAYSFKAAYGDAGLSGALWKMEKGQLDTYRKIHKLHKIGSHQFVALSVWSFLRFFRRVAKVNLRKLDTLD